MILQTTLLITGILLLWIGSGLVVESAKKLAKRFKISHALIGLTVISIGTSLPEIFTNIFSGIKNLQGIEASGIAVGTNIGSCLTQITLILGIIALIGTMRTTKTVLYRDGIMVLVAIAAMFLMGLDGKITRPEGIILIVTYIIYLIWISKDEVALKEIIHEIDNKNSKQKRIKIIPNSAYIVIGIAILIYGSKLVVDNAITIAETLGLAESFIGVMIIGVGTGLPELSTAIRGILKRASGISLGTLIGSNITDPMFSLGSGAVVSGFLFDKDLLFFDIPFWFLTTIIALFLMKKNMRLSKKERKEGIILISLYILFVVVKIGYLR